MQRAREMSLIFHPNLRKTPEKIAVPSDEIVLKGSLRRTVILVHGLTGTPNEMRYLAFTLNKRGYSVCCPQLANHGQSLHVLKHTTWEELYASLRQVFLKALETGDQVFVAGLSMSALFVLLLAEEFGSRLAGGVCYSPTLFSTGGMCPGTNRLLPIASYTPLKYSVYFKEGPPYGIKNEANARDGPPILQQGADRGHRWGREVRVCLLPGLALQAAPEAGGQGHAAPRPRDDPDAADPSRGG